MSTRFALVAALALVVATDGVGAELSYMGKPLPEAGSGGAAKADPTDADSVTLDGLSGKTINEKLSRASRDEGALHLRGPKEMAIYRNASSAVVMVVMKDGFGSGTYLRSGEILTNWHVVRSYKYVGIIYKPRTEGEAPNVANLVRADVLRTDVTRDLAVLRPALVPPHVRGMELGSDSEIQVGADVHAIGHPVGETWTYTRGLISQFRKGYEWTMDEVTHRANVIQTQTPISVGNSGGPLISESGKLIGVNSFGKRDAQAINFAVSVGDAAAFLREPGQQVLTTAGRNSCQPVKTFDGRTLAGDARLVRIDTNCDGRADLFIITPDDATKPTHALIDSNHDGKVDIMVEDTDRDGRWDISLYDTDFDGKPDLVGYHPDGKMRPSRFAKFEAGQERPPQR
jgi:S1-C subfamily serine protease